MTLNQIDATVGRRKFIKLLCTTGITIYLPSILFAAPTNNEHKARLLRLFHPDSKESLTTTYWVDGKYLNRALSDIDDIMRDHHTGEVRQIDTKLLDLMYRINLELGTNEPYHILSAYRCPETTALLKKQGLAVSDKSLHQEGKAVDIRLTKVQTSSLRRAAYRLKMGGVGYYPKLNFIHIDVGSIRYWRK
ncbi:MAG: DUF882 domain-containing protein [Deltaproteobacteria bacterium]|nr:DUF882 domain-containing protein [Deltaproteobacteria bacterium]